ncbi:MaoC/PaaZ C-terminal domain-containing protein [Halococcus thailandensis]|uniref:MaoC/PaaZ C-terminal domain-containing protein n=1 Tax=Halococcus thailandensis TaxID=335952 RepID=UPI0009B5ACCB|nr:MaoC/PaaZ C-terminal domain-containing protein [Halococcus thailandensis]
MTVDPVCGKEVSATEAEASIKYDSTTYYFCSDDCMMLFEKDPENQIRTQHPLSEVQGTVVPRLPYGQQEGEFDLSIQTPGSLGIGDRVTFTKAITEDDVRKFAEATSDTNAVHLNEEFAEQTRFGRRIAHGTLVSGMISAALACLPGFTIYLSQNLEFKRPVDIGATLTASCEIIENLENDRYRLTTRIENEDEDIVIHGTATVLIDELPAY